jgi:hypothetical protein
VNSLTGNLQSFGFDEVSKVATLQEIIEESDNVLAKE